MTCKHMLRGIAILFTDFSEYACSSFSGPLLSMLFVEPAALCVQGCALIDQVPFKESPGWTKASKMIDDLALQGAI